MPKLKFYDLKSKKSFTTDKFVIVDKRVNGIIKKFAVARGPSGFEVNKIMKMKKKSK